MSGGNVFISYRRGLDQDSAGRLYEAIEDRIGPERIFMDVDGIPPGVDFVDHLNSKLETCDAFLAVIGPGWIERMDELHKEEDFVRREFESVLGFTDKPFVPILFHGVEMPTEAQLPESLHPLARKNAVTMPHEHFSSVMSGKIFPMLSDALDEDLSKSAREKSFWARQPRLFRKIVAWVGGAGAIAALTAGSMTLATGNLGWFYNLSAFLQRGAVGSAAMMLDDERANYSRIDFSATGDLISSGDSNLAAKIWDIKSGEVLKQFEGHSKRIEASTFSRDGTRLATASQDTTARLWDIATEKELMQFKGHTDFVYSVEFSPDQSKIVTGSKDKTARVWDAATGEELLRLGGHSNEVEMAKFSPDGSLIATASLSGEIIIWDAMTGRQVEDFDAHTGPAVGLDFSPDGDLLATVGDDGAVVLWSTDNWTEFDYAEIEGERLTSVEFDPEGFRIIASATDGSIRIWDTETMEELGRYYDHGTTFWTATFSEDGSKVAGASYTKLVVREVSE